MRRAASSSRSQSRTDFAHSKAWSPKEADALFVPVTPRSETPASNHALQSVRPVQSSASPGTPAVVVELAAADPPGFTEARQTADVENERDVRPIEIQWGPTDCDEYVRGPKVHVLADVQDKLPPLNLSVQFGRLMRSRGNISFVLRGISQSC